MFLFSFPAWVILVCCSIFVCFIIVNQNVRTFVKENHEVITITLAIVAGSYVLVEYLGKQYEQRVEKTQSYVKEMDSGETRNARQWLDLHWTKKKNLLAAIDKAANDPNGESEFDKNIAEYMKDFNLDDTANEENVKYILQLLYFYTGLAKCVSDGLCDLKSACDLFGDDMGRFYVLHSSLIKIWRELEIKKVSFEAMRNTVLSCPGHDS